MKKSIAVRFVVMSTGLMFAFPLLAVTPTDWTTTIDSSQYNSSGSIIFNDWGYQGPNGARADTFEVTSTVTGVTGFDASRIGQIQTVTTQNPDWLTPDGSTSLGQLTNASLDSQVNFADGLFTTEGGTTFNNMSIDQAGNYAVAKKDMSFAFYDSFLYHDTTGTNPDQTIDTSINFKPYAVSDAVGWCGSTLISNPGAVDIMAGQVKFDYALDAYMFDGAESIAGGNTQFIPDFVMRSYGSYDVNVAGFSYQGSAVMNNANPSQNPLDAYGEITDAALDPDFINKVSFLGAGVVPTGVWLEGDSWLSDGSKRLNADGTWNGIISDVENPICDPLSGLVAPVDGAICYKNDFAGSPFLLRTDADRLLNYVNPEGHSDYVATVPLPAAIWLFSAGLLGLVGFSRRNHRLK